MFTNVHEFTRTQLTHVNQLSRCISVFAHILQWTGLGLQGNCVSPLIFLFVLSLKRYVNYIESYYIESYSDIMYHETVRFLKCN